MRFFHNFFWLAEQAVGFLFYIWPVTFALLLFIAITGIITFFGQKKEFRFKSLLGLLALIFPVLILVWGTTFERQTGTIFISILGGLLYFGQIPVGALLVYLASGYRWFVFAQIVFGAWVSLNAMFLAAMSITGDWI
ncbi:MAG: hypothetical protein JNM09_04000 [Blastocatellia bacterium]|nr:hypothetical protein [Blastocatellia bacterium]